MVCWRSQNYNKALPAFLMTMWDILFQHCFLTKDTIFSAPYFSIISLQLLLNIYLKKKVKYAFYLAFFCCCCYHCLSWSIRKNCAHIFSCVSGTAFSEIPGKSLDLFKVCTEAQVSFYIMHLFSKCLSDMNIRDLLRKPQLIMEFCASKGLPGYWFSI